MKHRFFKSPYFHILLFLLTLISTTIAGSKLIVGNFLGFDPSVDFDINNLKKGLAYSVPFLLILSAHEFGHYFMAIYHKIKTTLPYYIPLPIIGIIGTLGAVIRIKQPINSKKIYFDIGIAGPLAGFVVAIFLLFYSFTHLPSKDYIFSIHPEYKIFGNDFEKYAYDRATLRKMDSLQFVKYQRADSLKFAKNNDLNWKSTKYNPQGGGVLLISLGDNLIFYLLKKYIAPPDRMPHKYEMMHYPLLLAGYFALFFTALNLIPIGQLDGGHILYGIVGYEKSKIISGILFISLVFYGGLGIISLKKIVVDPYVLVINLPLYLGFLYFLFSRVTNETKTNLLIAVSVFTIQFLTSYLFPQSEGNYFWLFWAFILSRLLGIYHPPTLYEEPLDYKRKVLGWISLIVFVLCFSPQPLVMDELMF